jgi:drug/metabolite transporter (DMT)-like permease
MREILWNAAKQAILFIGLSVLVIVVLSAVVAYGSRLPFREAFGFCLIFGGVILCFMGAYISMGGAERGAATAALMTGGHRADFYAQYKNERQSRRDSQFFYMFLMLGSGAMLAALGVWVLG